MKEAGFLEALMLVLERDPRYDVQAYLFIREALDFTVKQRTRPKRQRGRHVSGAELLEGARQYALREYGPLARTVLARWGVERCEDLGEIVFNLVDVGILGKSDEDKKEDFAGGYDFDTAFAAPFRPKPRRKRSVRPAEKQK